MTKKMTPLETDTADSNPSDGFCPFRAGLERDAADDKMWMASGYRLVDHILKDPRFGKQAPVGLEDRLPDKLRLRNQRRETKPLNFLDPPEHTRVRRLMLKAFGAIAINQKRANIQAIADRILDPILARGQMDIIGDFAYPVSSLMICDLLGIPQPQRARLQTLTNSLIESYSSAMTKSNDDSQSTDHVTASELEFDRLITPLIDIRRRRKQADLISYLTHATIDAGQLSQTELLINIRALFIATHETLVNLIGNSVLALQQYPEQLSLLKTQPELTAQAVDELLRYDSPIKYIYRVAQIDVQIDGIEIRAGEAVCCALATANHDDHQFTCPSALNIERQEAKHKALGIGIHYCLGAQLLQLTTEIALSTLLKRIPTLALTDTEKLQRRHSNTIHGLTTLPATW